LAQGPFFFHLTAALCCTPNLYFEQQLELHKYSTGDATARFGTTHHSFIAILVLRRRVFCDHG